jgi:hypothetical protein
MSAFVKRVCAFVRCRERVAILFAVLFVVLGIASSRVMILSAFSGYNLRYPMNPDNAVDLSLHYIRFDNMYTDIAVDATDSPIVYTNVGGGRTAYLAADQIYAYSSGGFDHVAIRADAASPRLTARSVYSVGIPSDLIRNSGDYWDGFSDWQIAVPDPFGDATYIPSPQATVVPTEFIGNDVRVYFPAGPGSLAIDEAYPPTARMSLCGGGEEVDISQYMSLEYGTYAGVVQLTDIDEAVLSQFMDAIYGTVTDGNLTKCIALTFDEGALIANGSVGSYANGPQYQLKLLKPNRLVGAGSVVNTTNNNYTFEFDFNQAISKGELDRFARLYNADSQEIATLDIYNSQYAVIGDGSVPDSETQDTLYVTFPAADMASAQQYYVTLDRGAVVSADGWDRIRADMDSDDYRITIANDSDEPTVRLWIPSRGQTNVATSTQTAQINFDEWVTYGSDVGVYEISNGSATSTVTEDSIGQYSSISGALVTINVANLVNEAFATTTGLAAGTTYTFKIPQNLIRDDQNNEMPSPAYLVFTTVPNPSYDATRPIVISRNPTFGAVDIATSTQDISLTFDEPVYASSSVQTFRISNGVSTSTVLASSVGQYDSVAGSTLTIEIDELVNQAFSTTTGLAAETTYTVEVQQYIVTDDVGDYMDRSAYFVFTTVDNFDEPTVTPEEPGEEPNVESDDNNVNRTPGRRRSNPSSAVSGDSGTNNPTQNSAGGSSFGDNGGVSSIVRNLFFGATGTDVLELQRTLNRIGFTVNETGAGSPGMETQYYGTSTRAAVARFQLSFGIAPAFGYFGPITRAVLLIILGR